MLLWDVRENMEQNHLDKMESIKQKYQNKESYYVLVHVNWADPSMTVLKNTYLLMDKMPPKMLGTMLYYINNKKGLEELKWALPMDVVVDEADLDMETNPEKVIQHLKGIENTIQVS